MYMYVRREVEQDKTYLEGGNEARTLDVEKSDMRKPPSSRGGRQQELAKFQEKSGSTTFNSFTTQALALSSLCSRIHSRTRFALPRCFFFFFFFAAATALISRRLTTDHLSFPLPCRLRHPPLRRAHTHKIHVDEVHVSRSFVPYCPALARLSVVVVVVNIVLRLVCLSSYPRRHHTPPRPVPPPGAY